MTSPMECCTTSTSGMSIFDDVSPLETQSILERQQSSESNTGNNEQRQIMAPSSSKIRKGIYRRNTEPAAPRLNTSHTHRPSLSLNLIFTPRPLEVILAERAYLISSLHRQTMQSRQLIGEYSAFEAQLNSPSTAGKARRRLRKKLGRLRTQLDQAASQEKAIFVRLGEVYTELQSHAAWTEAALWRIPLQQQHQQPGFMEYENDSYFPGYGAPFSPDEARHGPQNTPLDPTLPVFVPGQPIYASSESSSALRFTSDLSNSSTLETVDETSEDGCSSEPEVFQEDERQVLYDYECNDEDDVGTHYERRIPHDEGGLSPREKRLSLPCLQSIWPEE